MILIALLLILGGCTTLSYMIGVQVGKYIGRQSVRVRAHAALDNYEARIVRYYRGLRP